MTNCKIGGHQSFGVEFVDDAGAFSVVVQKNGTILCWNAQFLFKMRAKHAEISHNFIQIFVKIVCEACRNFNFKSYFFKKRVIQCRLQTRGSLGDNSEVNIFSQFIISVQNG